MTDTSISTREGREKNTQQIRALFEVIWTETWELFIMLKTKWLLVKLSNTRVKKISIHTQTHIVFQQSPLEFKKITWKFLLRLCISKCVLRPKPLHSV